MRARAVISPGCDMPISMTATSCPGSSLSSMSGSPKWLLKLPADLSTWKREARTWDGFLGGGFTGGTGDTDHRFAPEAADRGGQSLQRGKSVVDGQQACGRAVAGKPILAYDRGHCA